MSSNSFDESTLKVTAEGALKEIEKAGSDADALVTAWLGACNSAAVQEVAERATGKVRKAARRALNVLKSRGVELPAPRRVGALQRPSEAGSAVARLMAPDPAGVRLLALSRPTRGGGCRACLVYFKDDQGVLRIENSETTDKKLLTGMKKIVPGAAYEPVEVPLTWARQKIANARKAHAKSAAPEPLGFSTARALLEPIPEEAQEHPFDAEGLALAAEDAKELAKDSGALHHLPEFRAWLPPEAQLRDLLANAGKQLTPGEEPSQDVVTELLKAEMLASTDRYFTPETRSDFVTRMKDAGVSLLAREGEQAALKVAATIQVIESCGLVTDPPQEVPFLRAFFEKGISLMMAQGGGKLNIPIPKAPNPEATV